MSMENTPAKEVESLSLKAEDESASSNSSSSQYSDADIIVFSTVHPYVISLPSSDKNKLPHLMRWMDYIQSTHNFGELFERIVLDKAPFDPPLTKQKAKGEAESTTKKAEVNTKKAALNAKAANSGADLEKRSDVVGSTRRVVAGAYGRRCETNLPILEKLVNVMLFGSDQNFFLFIWFECKNSP